MAPLLPYQKAGRVFRLIGIVQLVLFAVVVVAIAIPMFVGGRPEPKDLLVVLVFLAIFAFPVLNITVGNTILARKPMGRTAGYILAGLMLLGFPIGTLIGLYLLNCLNKDETP